MKKRLFITEAIDLISIIEDSTQANLQKLPIDAEEIANYWVNDILRAAGDLPVVRLRRYLTEAETYCTLTARESSLFMKILFHTIDKFDVGDLGAPTMHHCIENGALEFYILRG